MWLLLCSHIPIDFSQRSNQLVIEHTKELEEEYQLSLVGLGGTVRDDIEGVEVHYDIRGRYDLNSARVLYLKIAQSILDKINSDLPIRPYLHEYPATSNLLRLSLSFHDEDGSYPENKIAYISFVNSKICYRTHNDNKDSFEVVWRETFEEASNALNKKFVGE